MILSTLALQVAWYLWQWGAAVTWIVPDLRWGFKYDLDLIQATAVGAAVLLAPLVTYLVGRYHPLRTGGRHAARTRRVEGRSSEREGATEVGMMGATPMIGADASPEAVEKPGVPGDADAAAPAEDRPEIEPTPAHAIGDGPAGAGSGEPEQLRLLDDLAPVKQPNPYESA